MRLSGEVRLARFRWFPHVLFVHMGQGRREGTNRWVTRSTNRHKFSLSTTVSSVNIVRPMLLCPPHPCDHRMCVIAPGLSCLHGLAHAA